MSNQGQNIPKQMTLLFDDGSRVVGRPYRYIRATKHLAHHNDGEMTLCLIPRGDMRSLREPLSLGAAQHVVTCKVCKQAAARMNAVIRSELQEWTDVAEDCEIAPRL